MLRRLLVCNRIRWLLFYGALILQVSCSFGPHVLRATQLDYARALGDTRKREILSSIVGLRYADAPAAITLRQIIAAYGLDASGAAMGNSEPNTSGPRAGLRSGISYSNHPTFTFTPATGENYAKAYIYPLPPALILPLADSGVPIDLLLRITMQSIGGLNNAAAVGGYPQGASPKFFEALKLLRHLQVAGELSIQSATDSTHIKLSVGSKNDGGHTDSTLADLARLRELLSLSNQTADDELATRSALPRPVEIPVTMRSIMAILTAVAAEIPLPDTEVSSGAAFPPLSSVADVARPLMEIHVGKRAPSASFATISYGGLQFWIATTDFDTKYALSVLQEIVALAQQSDLVDPPVMTLRAN